MQFKFEVIVGAERDEGKFASKDELAEQIQEALESADPGQLDGENGGVYSVQEWEVNRLDG
jgi:hypothetical protein